MVHVALNAYGEVEKMVKELKEYYNQNSYSSTLRFIISEHYRMIKNRSEGTIPAKDIKSLA